MRHIILIVLLLLGGHNSSFCQETHYETLKIYQVDISAGVDSLKQLESVYQYNVKGFEIACKHFDSEELVYSSKTEYLNDSILVRKYEILTREWGSKDTLITYFSYDKKNLLTDIKTKNLDGIIQSYIKYIYNKAGLLVKEKRSNGMLVNYEYDSLNRLTCIDYTDIHRKCYDYDSQGRQIRYTTTSYPGWNNYCLYDIAGNKIEFLRFDNKGVLVQRERYFYNKNNDINKRYEYNEEINEPNFIYYYEYE